MVTAARTSITGLDSVLRVVNRAYKASKSWFSPFVRYYPAGHFYSPLPDLSAIRSQAQHELDQHSFLGIDLHVQSQCELLKAFSAYYAEIPFPETAASSNRYYYQNRFFSYGDAIVLYSMLRHFQPKKLVEVGSGFSSAVMLDTKDRFLAKDTQFTFIDPYPERLLGLLNSDDQQQHLILQQTVQHTDLAYFEALNAGDILLIDSSHVVKVGSDVGYLVFQVLPRLKPGVIIHFHDIFWSFDYPQSWLEDGIAWNEAYFLRAFLQYNTSFEILYFNSFMSQFHTVEVERSLPMCLKNPGGSLWLKKVK
ncbi:MAG: class I SAM-dependent methyltransferase [Leptolyngbya sp. UWPOB_LEPTO1]|uniref:class I SAM-dependent methyltransferase n=1 Tax=Leptolyngbya sp. UWPOB_LEPTO1 TaxID=2815653 RepID=UPI001ACDFF3E|nr:class I SAM-dependent methyltransferase [Leptolyngbya sp. UWPOB_LEPTO1]MBN8560360.1 class I SAM-dependent methyltransferase [Leptolyngbya sp. UWPOB_LEPTO1]